MTIESELNKWEEGVRKPYLKNAPETKPEFKSNSGFPVKPLYTPEDLKGIDYLKDIGFPGQFPFTRGRTPNGYRSFKWPHDFYSGYGSSESANERYRDLISHGANVITLALDLPTQIGYDSTDPRAEGEVGKAGVALASLADAERVLEGVDLSKVGLGFVANCIGGYALSVAMALCEKRGINPADLRHFRIQNDPLKEYSGRDTYIFPVAAAIELATDVVEYICGHFKDKHPWQWVPQYVCTTQMRWGGVTAPQEVGFLLAHFFTYIDSALERGLSIQDFVPKMDWHATADQDIFEEAAKFRAGRRLFARMMHERYKCDDPNVLGLRVSVWTSANKLTAQQPLNNLARITMQVLSAILGGIEHIWAPAYDEALALPTSESTRIANQIKYIIHHECGLENVIDPMGGSYYLERLTSQIEEEARYWFDEIQNKGGVAAAVEDGFYYREELKGLYQYQKEVEAEERKVVGINLFKAEEDLELDIFQVDPDDEQRQVKRVNSLLEKRDGALVRQRLEELGNLATRKASDKKVNLMPAMLAAVKSYATVGEIYGVLRKVFGEFKTPVKVS
ncbi:MAG: methylmalonyl-CoA mutase family protein [Chloroflexota bacterium]